MNKVISIKKASYDLILNIIGSFFITGISQLIVYPLLSRQLGQLKFGSLLTLIGLSNVIGVVIGNSLNNVRLLKENEYVNRKINGDFKYLLSKSSMIAILIMIGISIIFHKQIRLIEAILLIISTILMIYRAYINVYYRIDLNYKLILLQMVVTGSGYLFGVVIFQFIHIWPIIFMFGELSAYIMGQFTTKYNKESSMKTKLFKETRSDFIQLASSNIIVNLLLYADRLLINPILGAANVSIYFVASLVGKTIGIVLQPIASVMLAYISKISNMNKRKSFLSVVSIVMSLGIIGYIIIMLITPVIIKIFYRNSLELAYPYFNLANLAGILMIMGSLIQPMILKFCSMKWQMITQSIYAVIYLLSNITLMKLNGLMGFCIATTISNGIRLIIFLVLGYVYIVRNNEENDNKLVKNKIISK